jgi:hypothetical protein
MDSIREQTDLTNEISEAISNPTGMGNQVDEVCPYTPFHQMSMNTLIIRTSSRRNSKRSNRRNWTTDLQVQNERLFTLQPPQSELHQDENVCLPSLVHLSMINS